MSKAAQKKKNDDEQYTEEIELEELKGNEIKEVKKDQENQPYDIQ